MTLCHHNLTLKPPYFIHSLPPDPLYTQHNHDNGTFKIKAPTLVSSLKHSKQRPKKFDKNNEFPNYVIPNKNPHAVYKDIQKFAEQNKLKEALAIMDYLEHRGIPTNITTFSSLISACVRVKAIDAAKQVHVHVKINGLEKNEFLQTKLVNMYAACGAIEDAKKVFDEIGVTSVYPWNALLRGNVVSGRHNSREVLGSFFEMQTSGVELNVYSFSCLIKSLAGASSLRQGLKTHGMLIKNGFIESCIIRTSLIDMYFKCGKIKLARCIFEEFQEMDVVVWGAMIAGFAHNRLQREALEYTRWMIREGLEVNSVILTSILPVIGEVFARKVGQEVHAYVIKTKEYSKQLFIQSSLVDMYCKCGDMVSGRKVFYRSMERNVISWTTLLSGYVANGRLEQALRSIIWMQQEGFKPDVVTIATVLPVCGKLRALKHGMEVHAYAVKNGFLPGVSVSTSLMMMYSKCGVLDYCSKVFNNMEKKNVIAWTAMIECFIENQCLHEALGIFHAMQFSKHRPDSVTIARILSVCGDLKVHKLGKEIHGQALKKDFESIPFVSAEIIKMYGNWGAINEAKLSFAAVCVKGSMTWTAIIETCGCNGRYEEALHLFDEMMSCGSSPNQFTFKVVLCICRKAGLADDALRIFTLMTRKYKIKASAEHYTYLIDIFTRSDRPEVAEKFIQMKSSLACQ